MNKKALAGERCDFCEGGKLQFKYCSEIFRQNGGFIIIENVPSFVCNFCGMRYYLAETTKKMRYIAENKKKIKHEILIPIAEYDVAI